MKALSIRQPWAWAILNAGKDVENRDWKEHGPHMRQARSLVKNGEHILIHASAGMTHREYYDFANWYPQPGMRGTLPILPDLDKLQRGGIVGSCLIYSIVTERDSPWFFGPVGLVLADVLALPFRQFKGMQGFFEVEP